MPRRFPRRSFLRSAASLPALPLLTQARTALASSPAEPTRELVRDPKGILDLPKGYSYRVLSRSGETMNDGYRVPGHSDGMGVFAGQGDEVVLMRNHEVMPGDFASGPYAEGQAFAPEAYDHSGFGSVTRIVMDGATLAPKRANLVLTGTYWNCAGGKSPWGWLSCEEIVTPNHGYVFLCPSDAERVQPARPIKAYGRFRHEAAAVDPETLTAYLTEDIGDASFYRFVPRDRAKPFEGQLQALALRDAPRFDTSQLERHRKVPVHWVNVDDNDPPEDTIRLQAQAAGAAVFRRNEGLCLRGSDLFLCATAGGPLGRGQIFRLHDHASDHAQLELISVVDDASVLDMPDNLTVSPSGELYTAEDGLEGNFIRRIDMDGRVTDVAHNALSFSELAGPCFSRDGGTMFVNIQHDGLTLAIKGPFAQDAARAQGPAAAAHARTHGGSEGLLGLGGGLAVLALAALSRRKRAAQAQ